MDELIARLEKAEGGDVELDRQIHFATGWTIKERSTTRGVFRHWVDPTGHMWTGETADHNVPHDYTFSLDAALSLVPDNHTVYFTRPNQKQIAGVGSKLTYACVAPPGLGGPQYAKKRAHLSGYHCTTAIALCIAALRARQVQP